VSPGHADYQAATATSGRTGSGVWLFRGTTRFSNFQRSLGLARNILAARLDRFVEAGLMERGAPADRSPHHEYVLTDKGRDLQPVIIALTLWGDRWAAPADLLVLFQHAGCGAPVHQQTTCTHCGTPLTTAEEPPQHLTDTWSGLPPHSSPTGRAGS
jgi:DNA-binding MarR family transcriptional regulator